MIIARSPLRITLGGGGTDLPSYYEKHEGFLLAAAVDKYVYVTIHDTFEPEILVKYSKYERVQHFSELQHPIFREALRLVGVNNPHLEISSMADIPAGTGLGSSGSFTVALLKALHTYKRNFHSAGDLAQQACDIEIGILKEPIGKQDQYIAAFGGVTCFTFRMDGSVHVQPLDFPEETLYSLKDHLLLFFTGYSRSASAVLKEQDDRSRQCDRAMIDNLHFVKDLGRQSHAALTNGDLREFARLMNVHWEHKKKRSGGMSNSRIDEIYEHALKNGALGGKLIGAGGGGFLMFYCDDSVKLRAAMKKAGLKELYFSFDFEGTKTIVS